MNTKDFADMIRLVRSAPIPNMDEAEARARLLQRFAEFANSVIESDNVIDLPKAKPPPGNLHDEANG